MKKTAAYIFISLILTSALYAGAGALSRAKRNMDQFNFNRAIDICNRVVAKEPTNTTAKEYLAHSYRLINNTVEAELWYAELVNGDAVNAINKLYYAQALRTNGKYEEADKYFNEYATAVPSDSRSALKSNLKSIATLSADNPAYTISPLSINSNRFDFSPTFYNDGIIYTSNKGNNTIVGRQDNWTGQKFFDIWYTEIDESGNASSPVLLRGPQPNRKYHDGPACFSPDGNQLYFTRNNYITGPVSTSVDEIVKLKIFRAEKNGDEWSFAESMPFNSDEYSVAHPSISADGKKMYFISDMPGGLGETDIYVSTFEGDSWSNPVNLGKDVNTAGKEMFPYIAEDGTLYFASDSRNGLGGLDIYSATFSNNTWGNVQNLGAPVNTSKDDFGFIINKQGKGYLSSNRDGGTGNDDIYSFVRTGMLLDGYVVDADTKAKLSCATVTLKGPKGEQKTKVDANGYFKFTVDMNTKYSLSADGCEKYKANLNNEFSTPVNPSKFTITVPLSKVGQIVLNVNANAETKPLTGAVVTLTKSNGEKETKATDAKGTAQFVLAENSSYSVCVDYTATGKSCSRDCRDIKTYTAPAVLTENFTIYCEGDIVEIPDIYYDLDKYNIRPDAAMQLDKFVIPILNKYPNMTIELRSHTDCRGSLSYNNQLSQNRAKSAVSYLVKNNISSSRLTAKGYGETMLKVNCPCEGSVKSDCTEEQHQQNRRTEFKVLKLN